MPWRGWQMKSQSIPRNRLRNPEMMSCEPRIFLSIASPGNANCFVSNLRHGWLTGIGSEIKI